MLRLLTSAFQVFVHMRGRFLGWMQDRVAVLVLLVFIAGMAGTLWNLFVRPLDRQVEDGRVAQNSLMMTGILAFLGLVGLGLVYTRLRRTVGTLAEQTKQSSLVAEVALVLTRTDELSTTLQQCAEAIVRHLDAAFARIWTLNEAEGVLELQASAGMYTHMDGPHARVPLGQFKIGRIAQTGEPHLTNSVLTDPWVGNPDWARREGMVAFAGHPLMVDGRVVGVMAMFARRPLTELALNSLAITADGIALDIVRKRAEEAARVGEDRVKAVFETAVDGIVIINEGGMIEAINPATLRLFGYSSEELIGQNVNTLMPETYRVNHDTYLAAYLQTSVARVLGGKREVRGRRKDGTEFPLELSVSQAGFGARRVFIGVLRDISQQKRIEESLRASEERFRNLVEHATDAILLCTGVGKIVHINQQARENLGYTADELVGMRLADIDVDGTLRTDEELCTQIRSAQQSTTYRLHRRKDGFVFPVEVRSRPFEMDGQQFMMLTVRDVTERKQAEDTLRASEERYRLLFDANPHPMWVHDAISLRFLAVNDAAVRYYGYSRAEFESMIVLDIDPQSGPETWEALSGHVSRGPQVCSHRRVSGETCQVEVAAHPIEFDCQFAHLVLAVDVTERKLAEAAMQASEKRFRNLVEHIPDAIFVNDLCGTITDVNRRACESLGYTHEELIGLTIPEIDVDYPKEVIDQIRPSLLSGQLHTLYGHQKRKDGSIFPVEVRPCLLEMNGQQFAVSIVRDITERKRAEEDLREAKEKAEVANRLKSEFLANMSHEIRTPMNGIIGMTELALETKLTREQREYLETVKSSADALLTVINDILDFSKVEAGKLVLDDAPFRLRECVASAIKPLAIRAHQKGLELACRVRPDVPDALIGDSGRLRQVLVNLVGNAIKFTERGEVEVDIRVERRTADAAHLHIAIRDTGIGIPAEKIDSIFDPFTQADGSVTRRFGGTGLGLSISTRLATLMGGRVWAESVSGEGSTFHFTARLATQSMSDSRALPRPVNLDGLRVLVVDDNATNRRILEEVVTHWRMRPFAVIGGPEALAELNRAACAGEPYPLVLLDAMMPGMDGLAVAAEIVRHPEWGTPTVLMLSSAGCPDDPGRVRNAGVAAYLTKPVSHSDLLNAIQESLGTPQAATVRPGESDPLLTGSDAESRSARPLRILLAEDNLVNQRLGVVLLEKHGHEVRVANNGREALALLSQDTFDLVLMDVQMPEMDGFEATRAIRLREAGMGQHIPIIALTAHAMKGDRERCLAAGMDEYLTKPIRTHELHLVLARLFPGSKQPPQPETEIPALATEVIFDREELLDRLGGDIEVLNEIVVMFRADTPRLLQEIRESLKGGDVRRLGRAAHSLKGTTKSLAAAEAATAAQSLEAAASANDLVGAGKLLPRIEQSIERLAEALGREVATCEP